jgi:hypothetical protein
VVEAVAADADVPAGLADDAHTARAPRRPQLGFAVGELAVAVCATAVLVVPAEAHLVREALEAGVPDLAAPEADHGRFVVVAEGADVLGVY